MKFTKELYGSEGRKAMKAGMDRIALPVAKSMGAKGRNAIMRLWGIVEATNDGVTIARNIIVKDEFEMQGADLLKQVGEKQVVQVGDGTSTATTIAHALAEEGIPLVDHGSHPMILKRELEESRDEAIEILKGMAKPVTEEDIINVARISVENEALAVLVADASAKAGEFGEVYVEKSGGYKTEMESVEGYYWDRGIFSPYMITNDRGDAELEDCAVIVTDKGLNVNNDLMPLIGAMHKNGTKKFFVIADRIEGELLASMIANKQKGIATIIAVGRPETTEELEDIATICQGTAVTKDKGIKVIGIEHVGKAKRVLVRNGKTIIVGFNGPELQTRIEELKTKAALPENKDDVILKRRLAKLTSGITTIRVGAKTEAEAKYLKDKVDDAVAACRAAREEGIVPGGGVSLMMITNKMSDKTDGAQILKKALMRPFVQILENAGIKGLYPHNVLTGEKVSEDDMIAQGIVDPAKVERAAIENAVSFATMFLTTESVIADFEEIAPAPGA